MGQSPGTAALVGQIQGSCSPWTDGESRGIEPHVTSGVAALGQGWGAAALVRQSRGVAVCEQSPGLSLTFEKSYKYAVPGKPGEPMPLELDGVVELQPMDRAVVNLEPLDRAIWSCAEWSRCAAILGQSRMLATHSRKS